MRQLDLPPAEARGVHGVLHFCFVLSRVYNSSGYDSKLLGLLPRPLFVYKLKHTQAAHVLWTTALMHVDSVVEASYGLLVC